jgi:hypothetical protein
LLTGFTVTFPFTWFALPIDWISRLSITLTCPPLGAIPVFKAWGID